MTALCSQTQLTKALSAKASAIAAVDADDYKTAVTFFETALHELSGHEQHAAVDDDCSGVDAAESCTAQHSAGVDVQTLKGEFWDMVAQCHMQLGNDALAYDAACRAVQLIPTWCEGQVTLARAAVNSGRLQASIKAFTLALACGELEDRTHIEHELHEVESLLTADIARRVGLPQLHITQHFAGKQGPACVVWQCGMMLAWLLAHPTCIAGGLRGKRVFEMGSGTAIGGITAALMGAHVMMTDVPDVLPYIRAAIARHHCAIAAAGGTAACRQLTWQSSDAQPSCMLSPAMQHFTSTSAPHHAALHTVDANGGQSVFACEDCGSVASHVDAATQCAASQQQSGQHADVIMGHADIIMGSDLVYSLAGVDAMVNALTWLCNTNTHAQVLLVHKRRHVHVDAALQRALQQCRLQLREWVVPDDVKLHCFDSTSPDIVVWTSDTLPITFLAES